MSLRIVFMGTPDFSVSVLEALAKAGHEIVAVYSQPPRPGGRRGLEPVPSPVHKAALALGLPVLHPLNFKQEEDRERFRAHEADVAVVVAYGLLLPEAILNGTRLGCYNGHASLLPRWRGAAPIQRAIMSGDSKTGMMVMKMDKGLDTGPVALTREIDIGPDMTAGELHDALSTIAAASMVEAMSMLEAGTLTLTPQPDAGVLYAAKISKDETRIDFTRPAAEVHNHIRGLAPFPGAWFELPVNGKPERVKILGSTLNVPRVDVEAGAGEVIDPLVGALADCLMVACGHGVIGLSYLQKAGGKAVAAGAFLNGTPVAAGTRLA